MTQNSDRCIAEQIWLHYYNDVIHDAKLINDSEYYAMRQKIDARVQDRKVIPQSTMK